jgi:hypothetical protein
MRKYIVQNTWRKKLFIFIFEIVDILAGSISEEKIPTGRW